MKRYKPATTTVERYAEWIVDCLNCGEFVQVQSGEPTICPKCHSTEIDTTGN